VGRSYSVKGKTKEGGPRTPWERGPPKGKSAGISRGSGMFKEVLGIRGGAAEHVNGNLTTWYPSWEQKTVADDGGKKDKGGFQTTRAAGEAVKKLANGRATRALRRLLPMSGGGKGSAVARKAEESPCELQGKKTSEAASRRR